METTSGAYIVSWSFEGGRDSGVLIVGKRVNNDLEIVNAFQGEEAIALLELLSTRQKGD